MITLNEMNAIEVCDEDVSPVGITPILKREYQEKIKAKTKVGYNRAKRKEGGVGEAITLVESYWQISGEVMEDKMHTMVSLIANEKGHLLADRETIYWLHEKSPYVAGKSFNAGEVMEHMMDIGIIKEMSKSYHTKGLAREARIREKKGLSMVIVKIVKYFIDNPLDVLIIQIQGLTTKGKVDIGKIWDKAWSVSRNPSLMRRTWTAMSLITHIKGRQRQEGITVSLIHDLINSICPGFQPGRKSHVFKSLANHYNLNPHRIKETLDAIEDEAQQIQTLLDELEGHKVKDISGVYQNTSDINQEPTHPNIHVELSHVHETVSHGGVIYDVFQNTPDINPSVSLNTPDVLPIADEGLLNNIDDIFNLSTITSVKELNEACSGLRIEASKVMVEETSLRIGAYNQAIACNVLRYTPSDLIDMRQQEVMVRDGALPIEYQLCSDKSPRVYGRGVDNLFYCRKSMRLAAFETLGFQDVDISGCHVHVALGLWGDHLPLLNEHVSKGSLWKHYESLYTSAGLPFYKSLIKAMHHATLLGGGVNAYEEAHRSYNNHNPENPISIEMMSSIIDLFKSTDIYKELKALFKHLDNTLHNKTLTVLTGETFHVKGYRKYKDKSTGKVTTHPGNLLTVISAILQSFEVAMLSYLILRTNQLFIPVLWQHDGLTIKALYKNSVELMQQALDEFTLPLLNRSFKLESTPL